MAHRLGRGRLFNGGKAKIGAPAALSIELRLAQTSTQMSQESEEKGEGRGQETGNVCRFLSYRMSFQCRG